MTKSILQKLEDQVSQIETGAKPSGPSLLARGIRYLSMRDHSEIELRKKLRPHAINEEALDLVIEQLKNKNYLSNERFAENLVSRKSQTLGIQRMVQELHKHDVDHDIIATQVKILKESEAKRAFLVWEKKFGQVTNDPQLLAKQIRFLASRGFDQELIYKIVKGKTLDDSK
jgi:regulatory protein